MTFRKLMFTFSRASAQFWPASSTPTGLLAPPGERQSTWIDCGCYLRAGNIFPLNQVQQEEHVSLRTKNQDFTVTLQYSQIFLRQPTENILNTRKREIVFEAPKFHSILTV